MRPTAIEWTGIPVRRSSIWASRVNRQTGKMAIRQGNSGNTSQPTTARGDAGDRQGAESPKDAPTPAREPAQWSLPAWVAGPPAAVLFMAIGLATCALSWLWADESYSASIMTARLLAADRTGQRGRLPESMRPANRIVDSLDLRNTWRTGRCS